MGESTAPIRLLRPRDPTPRREASGFEYLDADGDRVDDPEDVARIRELGIPPAWKDVWICADANGHLQATGVDAAGRKQYLYHERWRVRRDAEKFEDMARFAPRCRACASRSTTTSTATSSTATRVLACAVRLLDRGFFRIGSEEYAVQNASYGLATMRKRARHARRGRRDGLRLPGQERPAARAGGRRPEGERGRRRRSSGAAAAARSCSRTRRAAAGTTCAPRTSTRTSRTRPATTSRPRTSAPGTRPCWPRSRWPCPARSAATEDRPQARDRARGQGGRPLPRQHARGLPRLLHRPARVRRLPTAGWSSGSRCKRRRRRGRRAADPPPRRSKRQCST